MKWANETTREIWSNPPWPPGTIVTDSVLAQYADWKQVPDDYELLRLLLAEKTAAKEKIKAERTRRDLAGFLYAGKTFDSDRDSITKINAAAGLALAALMTSQSFAIDWTAADNTDMPLDAVGMVGLQQALGQHSNALHVKARAIKERIDAVETVAAIDEILADPDLWEGE